MPLAVEGVLQEAVPLLLAMVVVGTWWLRTSGMDAAGPWMVHGLHRNFEHCLIRVRHTLPSWPRRQDRRTRLRADALCCCTEPNIDKGAESARVVDIRRRGGGCRGVVVGSNKQWVEDGGKQQQRCAARRVLRRHCPIAVARNDWSWTAVEARLAGCRYRAQSSK